MPIDDDDGQEEWLLDYLQDVCNVRITLNISCRGEERDERRMGVEGREKNKLR